MEGISHTFHQSFSPKIMLNKYISGRSSGLPISGPSHQAKSRAVASVPEKFTGLQQRGLLRIHTGFPIKAISVIRFSKKATKNRVNLDFFTLKNNYP